MKEQWSVEDLPSSLPHTTQLHLVFLQFPVTKGSVGVFPVITTLSPKSRLQAASIRKLPPNPLTHSQLQQVCL